MRAGDATPRRCWSRRSRPRRQNPERVVGMHFFNPAPIMRLLEVVAGEQSSEDALALAHATGEAMGKTVIRAHDGPGFLVNRCNRPFGLEALRLLQERIAEIETIDRIVRLGGRLSHGAVRADGPRRDRHGPGDLQELLRAELRRAALAPFPDRRALRRRRAATAARAGVATTTTRDRPHTTLPTAPRTPSHPRTPPMPSCRATVPWRSPCASSCQAIPAAEGLRSSSMGSAAPSTASRSTRSCPWRSSRSPARRASGRLEASACMSRACSPLPSVCSRESSAR